MTSILEVKGDSLFITGILHLETRFEFPALNLITAGDDILNLCNIYVTLQAIVSGDLEGHTLEWEQISPIPDNDVNNNYTPNNQLTFTFEILNGQFIDRTYRFYVDRGTSQEQFDDVNVIATPQSDFYDYVDFDSFVGNPIQNITVNQITRLVKTYYSNNVVNFSFNNIIADGEITNLAVTNIIKLNKEYSSNITVLSDAFNSHLNSVLVTKDRNESEYPWIQLITSFAPAQGQEYTYKSNTDYSLIWNQFDASDSNREDHRYLNKDNVRYYHYNVANTDVVYTKYLRIAKWTVQTRPNIFSSWSNVQDFYPGQELRYEPLTLDNFYRVLTTFYIDYNKFSTYQVASDTVVAKSVPKSIERSEIVTTSDTITIRQNTINTFVANTIPYFAVANTKTGSIGG